MVRTWKLVPDEVVIKEDCSVCGEPSGRQCSYAEASTKGKRTRKKSRKAGMHFARWEAAYTRLYGPPNVPTWGGSDGLVENGMFNGQDFAGSGKAWDGGAR
jgi:hypothetical protein